MLTESEIWGDSGTGPGRRRGPPRGLVREIRAGFGVRDVDADAYLLPPSQVLFLGSGGGRYRSSSQAGGCEKSATRRALYGLIGSWRNSSFSGHNCESVEFSAYGGIDSVLDSEVVFPLRGPVGEESDGTPSN